MINTEELFIAWHYGLGDIIIQAGMVTKIAETNV